MHTATAVIRTRLQPRQTSSMSSPAIYDVPVNLGTSSFDGGKFKLISQFADLLYNKVNYNSAAVNIPGVKSVKKTLNANLRSLLGV